MDFPLSVGTSEATANDERRRHGNFGHRGCPFPQSRRELWRLVHTHCHKKRVYTDEMAEQFMLVETTAARPHARRIEHPRLLEAHPLARWVARTEEHICILASKMLLVAPRTRTEA
jgi:hypothetical protein